MLKKSWRRFNTILFLFAFWAPWLSFCGSNKLNGFETTILSGAATADLGNQSTLLPPIVFVGLICILLYSLISLIFSFGITTEKVSRLRIGALVGGCVGMLSLVLASFSDSSTDDFLWGYWLTWVGLLSSIAIEITESRAKKTSGSDG